MNDQAQDEAGAVPRIPDPFTIDWQRARIVHDRPSDELLVYFGGIPRAAASIALDVGDRDFIYDRVDPATGETVGMEIDGFLAYAVRRYPAFVAFLARTELGGYDDLDAANLRRWAREQNHEQADDEARNSAVTPLTA